MAVDIQTDKSQAVVIVTGGARGIGNAFARRLAEDGYHVAIIDLQGAQEAAEQIRREGGLADGYNANVVDAADWDRVLGQVGISGKRLHGLVNNAALFASLEMQPFEKVEKQEWMRVMEVNTFGPFLAIQKVVPILAQGGGGAIVNCGSIHSFVGKHNVTAYSAAKGGVKLLTQTAAIDYAKHNIRVNAICPGYIDTPLLKHYQGNVRQALIDLHPQGRLGKPEEVASAVLFLASDEASFINGTSLLVDGGYTAQ